jgi:tetratricopeptide (TPR) repeat protein
VLDAYSIDRAAVPRQDLVDLMQHLGGHPLSLYLALPHLRQYKPAELTARFEELLPGFTAGAAVKRNESLAVSLEFSLRRLGDATRAALPDLAVFQGSAFEDDLLAITGMDPDLWAAARAELEGAALVSVESLPGVNPPFLRFHPTLAPYLASQLPAARRAELEERYWRRYYVLADYLYDADTQTPHQARAIALRELPNLRRALDLAIAAGATAEAVDFATRIARFLDNFGRWRERDALLAKISVLQSLISSDKGITKAEYLMLDQRGDALLQAGRAAQAERVFRELLERLEVGAAYDTAYDHAMTLWRLGRCLAAQGRPAQAIEWQRQALGEFEPISESSESAKEMLGKVYTDLGANLAAVGQFDEAQRAYDTSLGIKREVGDNRGVGVALGQLGTLALRRGDLAEAVQRYTQALETFRSLGEPQMEGVAWHQLGRVAQEARKWDEAERCYRESLKLNEAQGDLPGVARTCNQLARVAQGAGRLDDAERWYLRAIEIDEQLDSPKGLAQDYNNLAGLYLSQGRLDEAERYARRAVEIKETLDLSATPWTTYSLLAQIAEARGRADEAAAWRRKEQESYAAYAGAGYQLPRWAPSFIAAVVKAVQGNQEARGEVEKILPQLEAGGWDCPPVIRRILNGESDADELCVGLDRGEAYIVRTILAQLSGSVPTEVEGETPQTPGVSETPGVSGAEAAITRIRQQWAPVVQAVVAACGGNAQAAAQLEPLLAQLSQQDDWRGLVAALCRVLAGEREPEALLSGLDATDTIILSDVLRALGAELASPRPESGEGPGERADDAISLDDLLTLVATACRPDAPPGLGEGLHAATRTMAADPGAPAELRALGRVLNHILSGERDPDLSALPPEVADKVRGMLATL